jgi:formate dehydrogenase maturation protein FdhE
MMLPLKCKKCGTEAVPMLEAVQYQLEKTKEWKMHVKATCPTCDAYIKFLPQSQDVLEELDRQNAEAPAIKTRP